MRQDLASAIHLNNVKDEQIQINRRRADMLLKADCDLKRGREGPELDDPAFRSKKYKNDSGNNLARALPSSKEKEEDLGREYPNEDKSVDKLDKQPHHAESALNGCHDHLRVREEENNSRERETKNADYPERKTGDEKQLSDDRIKAAKLVQFAVTCNLPHIDPHVVQAAAVSLGAQVALAKGWERSTFRAIGLSILEVCPFLTSNGGVVTY